MKRDFTGQDPDYRSRENLVTITRGEFNKAALEEPLLPKLIPEQCRSTPDGNEACLFAAGHSGRCSWDV